jgi:hypothetical protein
MKNKSSTDKASRGRRTDSAVKKTGEDEQVPAHALVKLPPAQSNQVAARRRITSGATTERREKLSTSHLLLLLTEPISTEISKSVAH